ncbi:unnamed protein product [Heligmosomoides polygyrus]|uniref:Uncharacterized protein n=1 Tax=Heligmosomoides polygyrus TaxID=6339 RepID=A0A183FT80_HELPZ|nr:unnamed protein product [Heligmosomoides polygyrus]
MSQRTGAKNGGGMRCDDGKYSIRASVLGGQRALLHGRAHARLGGSSSSSSSSSCGAVRAKRLDASQINEETAPDAERDQQTSKQTPENVIRKQVGNNSKQEESADRADRASAKGNLSLNEGNAQRHGNSGAVPMRSKRGMRSFAWGSRRRPKDPIIARAKRYSGTTGYRFDR